MKVDSKRFAPLSMLSISLFVMGIIVFAAYTPIFGKPPWGVLVATFIFATSITQGALAIAVILRITSSRWGASLYRLAASIAVGFFPFGLIMLIAIFFGKGQIFYWADEAHHPWQNYTFFIARNLITFLVAYVFIFRAYRISNESKNMSEDEVPALNHKLLMNGFFVILSLIAYQTIMSIDLGMTLNQHWSDTFYTLLFMMISLYGGTALLAIIMYVSKNYLKVDTFKKEHFQSISYLLFTFTLMWTFFWYSQYFNIWYVNIPEETSAIFLRVFDKAYRPTFLASLVLLMGIPFARFLYHKIRNSHEVILLASVSVLLGVWLERYLIVIPALVKNGNIKGLFVLNPVNIVFTLGILGGTAYTAIARIKKNEHVFPDSEAQKTDALFIDPKGWQ